jgi:hypothetical protein
VSKGAIGKMCGAVRSVMCPDGRRSVAGARIASAVRASSHSGCGWVFGSDAQTESGCAIATDVVRQRKGACIRRTPRRQRPQ